MPTARSAWHNYLLSFGGIAVTFVRDKFEVDAGEMKDEKKRGVLEDLAAALAEMLKKTRGADGE